MAFESTLGSTRASTSRFPVAPGWESLPRQQSNSANAQSSAQSGGAGFYEGIRDMASRAYKDDGNFWQTFHNQSYGNLAGQVASIGQNAGYESIMSPMRGVMDFLTAFNSPTLQGFQNEQSRLLGLQAATEANFGAQRGFLQQGSQLDKALLEIQRRGIGVQQEGNQQEYGFLDRLRGLSGQGYANTQAQINEKAEQQHRATKNEFVGRGAVVAPEHGLQHEDIDQETAQAIEAARIGYEKEQVGFDQAKARLDQAGRMLGLDLEKLGINEQQLNLQLEMGLANLGLESMLSTNEFWTRLENAQGEELSFWMDLFNQAFQWGQMGNALASLGVF